MKPIRVILLLFLATILAGCGSNCRSLPDAVADTSIADPLEFRILNVTYSPAPEAERVKNKMFFESKPLLDLRQITRQALAAPENEGAKPGPAVTVSITVKGMLIGSHPIWGQIPSYYAARYAVTDLATGKVLLAKDYECEQGFVRQGDMTCMPLPDAVEAFRTAVNLVTGQFLHDLTGLKPAALSGEPAHFHGTLERVYTDVPLTKDNIRWIVRHAGQRTANEEKFTSNFRALMYSKLPAEVSRVIDAEHLFDYDPGTTYSIRIVAPRLLATHETWTTKPRNRFVADAVIYKGEEEIGNVELSPTECEEFQSFDSIADQYAKKITAYLNAMNVEESE